MAQKDKYPREEAREPLCYHAHHMIGQLEGNIWEIRDKSIILGVGGVGYILYVTDDTVIELSTKRDAVIRIWTHMVVREDTLDLFGFQTERDLSIFELLISVSGIGPKKALAILSLAPAATLIKAISTGDSGYLTKVSGVGRKNAEKLVLELKEKMGAFATGTEGGASLAEEADLIAAVQALGYSLHETRKALGEVPKEVEGLSSKIKAVLKILSSSH